MSDVVNRLRASKRKFENEQYQDGHAAGQSWAKEEAEAGELIRLEELHRHVDLAYFLYTDQDCKYSAAELLVFHVWPEYQGDRHAAGTFWERLGHQGQMDGPQDDFVRGFVDGAVSVWNDVRNQI